MIYVLNKKEVNCQNFYRDKEQALLGLLQMKGAPIEGLMNFKIQDGYCLQRRERFADGTIAFTFKKVVYEVPEKFRTL